MSAVDTAIQLTEKLTGITYNSQEIAAAHEQMAHVKPAVLDAYNTNIQHALAASGGKPLPKDKALQTMKDAATAATHTGFGLPQDLNLSVPESDTFGRLKLGVTLGQYGILDTAPLTATGNAFTNVGQMIETSYRNAAKPANTTTTAGPATPPADPHAGMHQVKGAHGNMIWVKDGESAPRQPATTTAAAPPPADPPQAPPTTVASAGGPGSGQTAGANGPEAMLGNLMKVLPGMIKEYGFGTTISAFLTTGFKYLKSMLSGEGDKFDFGKELVAAVTDIQKNNAAATAKAGGANGPGASGPVNGTAGATPPNPANRQDNATVAGAGPAAAPQTPAGGRPPYNGMRTADAGLTRPTPAAATPSAQTPAAVTPPATPKVAARSTQMATASTPG